MEFEGIVIRRTSFKESAAMITVLTKDRIRSFLAKGVLKITSKNAPSVNLFTKSLFQTFHGAEGDWLRVGEVINSYPNLTKDFQKLAILDFISEITNNLIGENDATNVYPFLEKTLEALNGDFSPLTALLIYFAKVLQASGYGLDVDSCVICGKKEGITTLSFKDGGFICKNCFDASMHDKNDARKLKIIRYIFKVDIDNFQKIAFSNDECKNIIFEICDFLNYSSQIEFKSLNLLRQI